MANYKKFVVLLLIFSMYMMPFNLAYANAALGGWSITDRIRQGASTVINATKTVVINGSNVVKTSTAVIKPTASQVAKILARGGGGYALSIAVEQLLGAVDWVLDPANNQIKYREKDKPADQDPTVPRLWAAPYEKKYIYDSAESAGSAECKLRNEEFVQVYAWFPTGSNSATATSAYVWCKRKDGTRDNWAVDSKPNPIYDPNAEKENEEKTIPLETVAERVISNAEAGDTDAKGVTGAAADDALANDPATQDNVRQQLDSNAKTNTAEGANEATGNTKPVDPAKPDAGSELSLKFPVFCSWAPTVCEAAQTVISFPQTLTNWWDKSTKSITDSWTWTKDQYNAITKSVTEFFKEKPEQNNNVDVDGPPPVVDIDTSFNFGGQCPAPITLIDSNMMGVPFKIEFSFEDFCFVLESFVRPVMYALSGFIAILIYSGVRTNNE